MSRLKLLQLGGVLTLVGGKLAMPWFGGDAIS
jgi:hypothetical protein